MMTSAGQASGRHPELRGQVAVVTGAARGIGFGIARRLIAEGMQVVAADIDASTLDDALDRLQPVRSEDGEVESGSAHGFVGDLSTVDAIDRLFESVIKEFGSPYLLVNNAADLRRNRVLENHQELLETQMATNVTGPYVCSQRAAAAMAQVGHGVIVNLSSVGATRAHHRGLPYDVTKGAIDAMTRAMAVDLGPMGIRVNAVAPGVTRTCRSSNNPEDPKAKAMADRIPLRRSGTVDDIAASVAFLASDDAAYITGQILIIDGGITAQLSPQGPHEF